MVREIDYWISLPIPPSTNRRMIMARGRMILSSEARDYIEKASLIVHKRLQDYNLCPRTDYVAVDFSFIFNDNRRRDAHNYLKILCDVLERGGLVSDDRYILPRILKPIVIKDVEPCVTVSWRIENEINEKQKDFR